MYDLEIKSNQVKVELSSVSMVKAYTCIYMIIMYIVSRFLNLYRSSPTLGLLWKH